VRSVVKGELQTAPVLKSTIHEKLGIVVFVFIGELLPEN
jgi:hypothetical protein